MSVSSTRRVSSSTSYSSSVKGSYEVAQGRQSFVETIDTTNNVLVSDEQNSGNGKAYRRADELENEQFSVEQSQDSETLNSNMKTGRHLGPLLDNDEDTVQPYSKKNVGIYGNNQVISHPEEEKVDNPYLKHLYEKNEIIEDVDEFV